MKRGHRQASADKEVKKTEEEPHKLSPPKKKQKLNEIGDSKPIQQVPKKEEEEEKKEV
jgi:hypothetical protein